MRVGRPDSIKLRKILADINAGAVKIPEFQRDFRWEIGDITELVVSIMRGFPVGVLLLWDVRESKEKLCERLVEGVNPLYKSNKTVYLILDGQQRLTSLYQLFYCDYVTLRGGRKRRFFINLEKLRSQDFDNCIEYYSEKEVKRQNLDNIKNQVTRHLLPFNVLVSDNKLREWRTEYVKAQLFLQKESNDLMNLPERLSAMMNQFDMEFLGEGKPLNNLLDYFFHYVELPSDLSLEAVATIFEKLNTTGQPLNIFEILTAKFYNKINLRGIWDETKDNHSMIKTFTKDEKDTSLAILIMKSILLRKSIDDPKMATLECKRKNLLEDLEVSDIENYWNQISTSFDKCLNILSNDYGSPSIDYLPYSTMLSPMSVIIDFIEKELNISQKGTAYSKLRSWYWASVLSGRYDSATDTKSKEDVVKVIEWIKGKEAPEVLKEFDAKNINFEEIVKGASYKGLLSILIMEGCADFVTREQVSTLIKTNPSSVDVHHVFPIKFLERHYGTKSAQVKKADAILNKVIIRSDTNRNFIKDDAPSTYLDGIRKINPLIDEDVKKHLLPLNSMVKNDFDSFMNEREEMFIQKIQELVRR